jgi:histidine ammonia-lyase
MSKMKNIVLNGESLDYQDIFYITQNDSVKVEIAPKSILKAKRSNLFLQKAMKEKVVYGVNTGFGPMASHLLGRDQLQQLQLNLIRSHAAGIGNPIDNRYVLAAMVVRLNTLAKGYSGVSIELLNHLKTFINKRIIPIVPEHGAVGTSGDLVQLAHIALALIGEGEVFFEGKRQLTTAVLKRLGIKPYVLKPKEGLSLINGTSVMTGTAAVLCEEARLLIDSAIELGSMALELVNGFDDSFSEALSAVRPHNGQVEVAKRMRTILKSSKLLRNREKFHTKFTLQEDVMVIPETVQEVYSLRCIPQIIGPVYDTWVSASEHINIEMNSTTDNPVIDADRERYLHGGNFHGDYIAAYIDQLKIAIVKLTMLSERRINFFMNCNVNKFFPPFMNLMKPGLTLGLQGLQFVATSTTAQSQTLAYPQHIHSIPTNGDNQDVVSMGTDAALLASKVIDNAFVVLAIESVTYCQAVDLLKCSNKLSNSSAGWFDAIREIMPAVVEDRYFGKELQEVVKELKRVI